MNKILLFVALFLSFNFVYSQNSLTILDTHGDNVENDTVYVSGSAYDTEIVEEFIIVNKGVSTLSVKAKKNDVFLVDSAEHVFCWVLCYGAGTFVSPFNLSMVPGDTTSGADNLSSHYRPDSMPGTSTVTLTVFDMNNEPDSAMVTVIFTALDSTTNINSIH